jgi:hypothetical protein
VIGALSATLWTHGWRTPCDVFKLPVVFDIWRSLAFATASAFGATFCQPSKPIKVIVGPYGSTEAAQVAEVGAKALEVLRKTISARPALLLVLTTRTYASMPPPMRASISPTSRILNGRDGHFYN